MPHTDKPLEIAIIGAGFSGLMTTYHLLRHTTVPITIHLINGKDTFAKGAAYTTPTYKHLLNVPTSRMSALPEDPDHFLHWAGRQAMYRDLSREVLARTFLPRKTYGAYIFELWEQGLRSKRPDSKVDIIHDSAVDIEHNGKAYTVHFKDHAPVHADQVVLATGHEAPANPKISNMAFYDSPSYVRNPWLTDVTKHIKQGQDILILGNGLTMVDIVLTIMESGYTGRIHSLSPSGFAVLPHRHNYIDYPDLVKELKEPYRLEDVYKAVYAHFRKLHKVGISIEPVVDSLRPITQQIWQSWTPEEKKTFVRDLSSLWGKVRHRIAPHLYSYIQGLRVKGRLIPHKGRAIDITEGSDGITARYLSKRTHTEQTIHAGLVINCTGPNTDISRSEDILQQALQAKGLIRPDSLRLGMDVTDHWTLLDADGKENPTLHTLGNNLRGLLWESIAIPELKGQTATLAKRILEQATKSAGPALTAPSVPQGDGAQSRKNA